MKRSWLLKSPRAFAIGLFRPLFAPLAWQNAYQESWRALEDLHQAGKIKAIGVSNFQSHHLKKLLATAKVKPVLNQVELHPKLAQKNCVIIVSNKESRSKLGLH